MKTKKNKQICWDCKNACGNGCSWFQNFVPVDGWKAKETIITDSHKRFIKSFKITKCPQFVPDSCEVKRSKNVRKRTSC